MGNLLSFGGSVAEVGQQLVYAAVLAVERLLQAAEIFVVLQCAAEAVYALPYESVVGVGNVYHKAAYNLYVGVAEWVFLYEIVNMYHTLGIAVEPFKYVGNAVVQLLLPASFYYPFVFL